MKAWRVVNEGAERGDFDMLVKWDELREEMKEGGIFSGFQEGVIRFPPTFKVQKGTIGPFYLHKRLIFLLFFLLCCNDAFPIPFSSLSLSSFLSLLELPLIAIEFYFTLPLLCMLLF